MLNKKQKELAEREVELYKKSRMLEVDKNIHERKINNWKFVDDARVEYNKKKRELEAEIAKLEAKEEALKKIVDKRDSEVEWLRNVILEAVKPAPKEN